MKLFLLSSLVCALLLPAAQASANTYDVYSCWAGYGTFHNPNASSAAWAKDQTALRGILRQATTAESVEGTAQ